MKTLKFFLPALFLLTFFSCKKKENSPEAPATTTGSTSTSTVPAYYGVLYSYQFDMLSSGTLTPMNGNSSAIFSSSAFVNYPNIYEGFMGNALDAGTVSINGTILKKTLSGSNYYYGDSTTTLFNPPQAWLVSGLNGVPAISFTNTSARPVYTGYATLKDTIKISQNNVFALTGISGADDINIYIFGGANTANKTLAGDATSVTFGPSDLSLIGATNNGSIMMSIYKNTYVSFGGKNYKFKIGYMLYKTIVVQ